MPMTEEQIKVKEKQLKTRENEVARLEKFKQTLEDEHNKKIESLELVKSDLIAGKDKQIREKQELINELTKNKAQLMLAKQTLENEIALVKANINIELDTYKQEKQLEVLKITKDKLESLTNKIDIESTQMLENLMKNVGLSRSKIQLAYEELINQYNDLIQAKIDIVDQEKKELEQARQLYQSKILEFSDIEVKRNENEIEKTILNRKAKSLENIINSKVDEKYRQLTDDVSRYQQLYEDSLGEIDQLKRKNLELTNDITTSKILDTLELQGTISRLQDQNREVTKRFGGYSQQDIENFIDTASEIENTREQFRLLANEKHDLENQLLSLQNENRLTTAIKFENETLNLQVRTKAVMLEKLSDELAILESRISNAKTDIGARKEIEDPLKDFKGKLIRKDSNIEEMIWVEGIYQDCLKSGFKFPKRLFYSFHTCIKTQDMSPLTVLAGVSGTGKSKLPQLYSRFGGIYFISVAVQPDWDSPQSLFGFFNSVDKRFNATTLLRAMVSFQKEGVPSADDVNEATNLNDHLLFILLDEMNLAHVELYFSEMLSKLEEQRGDNKTRHFEVDLGAGQEKYLVQLTQNVKWIGTMNEDETTKSLSDKVIDRGQVISFPRPKKFERYNQKSLEPERPMIKKNTWNDWTKNKVELTPQEAIGFMQIVMDINEHMKTANRALGHRVWQSIENYMISHPIVIQNSQDPVRRAKALSYAFEEAIVHKIITKLRGIETEGNLRDNCLLPIKNALIKYAPNLQKDFEKALNSITGTFLWDSSDYLEVEYTF